MATKSLTTGRLEPVLECQVIPSRHLQNGREMAKKFWTKATKGPKSGRCPMFYACRYVNVKPILGSTI